MPQSDTFSLETLWKQSGFKPNEEQERAIKHVNEPLYITAGPGSGKTRVLLWRTVNLIVFHDIEPEEIVLTTFTEKAAHQLKEGLQSYLGMARNYTNKNYDLAKMYIGTVHSVCNKLLSDRRFSENRRRTGAVKLMDALEQYFFIKRHRIWNRLLEAADIEEIEVNAYLQKKRPEYSNKHKAITECISLFNRFSEERLNIKDALQKTKESEDQSDSVLHAIILMYQEYRKCLVEESDIELSDLALIQEKAIELIDSNEKASNVFEHIIVDEYQDTNYIQEQLYFKLAGNKNICVVGDDDQALYRFRGSTVENFVEFPARVKNYLGCGVTKIPLSLNYRSRKQVVDFYCNFIDQEDWKKNGNSDNQYRVHDKGIRANSVDEGTAVVTTNVDDADWIDKTARLCKQLIDNKVVKDPNQIAFLFPSVRDNTRALGMIQALNQQGINVYAPRANIFLEGTEASEVLGVFSHIFETPDMSKFSGFEFNKYKDWLRRANRRATQIINDDLDLKRFVQDKNQEIHKIQDDYNKLIKLAAKEGWNLSDPYDPEMMRRKISTTSISEEAKKTILSPYLAKLVNERFAEDNPLDPFKLSQIINRMTSLDWSLMDIFYQLTGFTHFKEYFDQAQVHGNEAPIWNLSKLTDYLTRFMEMYSPTLSANFFSEESFSRLFFSSFLYTIYRMGETEYENDDDPFPKGNVSLFTIHQSKGLEFPVVFVYPSKQDRGPGTVETIIRKLKKVDGEPLDKIARFDLMRMFYVGFSRAEQLMIVPQVKGRGISVPQPMKDLFSGNEFTHIDDLEVETLPEIKEAKESAISKPYSYTADYLAYDRCPRQYMIFRKYGFTPSRSQTMFFGSLVHNTIEDLHNELIAIRNGE